MGPMESSDSEESSSEEDEKDKDSQDYADGLHVESKGIECEYQDWQMETPVACNSVYEVDMRPRSDSFFLLGCGGDRCAFKVADYDEHLPIVLKASRGPNEKHWEWNRKDVLVMEQLTSSPYIVNVYGYCGLSHFEEYGGRGTLHDRIQLARDYKDQLVPLKKLRICVQIMTALADMRFLGVAHNDICCHQIILIDGIFKLNDFNLVTFVRRNKRTNAACRDPQVNWVDHIAKTRSPEEVGEPWHDHWFYDLRKVAVFMAGNVMFYVLTNHWTFEGYTVKEAVRMMRRGQRSQMPQELLDSTDPAIRAMVSAIRSCWKQKPSQRPSSREISDFLTEELRRIERTKDVGVVRVSVPIFPRGYQPTDFDFHDNIVLGYPGEDDLFSNAEHMVSDDNFDWSENSGDQHDH